MAGNVYVKKRLWNPELLIDTNEIFGTHGQKLRQVCSHISPGSYRPLYEIVWTGTTQAGEELGTPATAIKDGSTTPFLVTVVSSDAADDRGTVAGAVHSVALIGVTTNSLTGYAAWQSNPNSREGKLGKPKATVEVVATNGTADVLATRYFIWLDGIYACEWGTGATDATGIITAESPANTNLLVLAATYNEGEGGVWHFPPGHGVVTRHISITPTATFAAGDGVVLTGTFTSFFQSNNDDPDLNVDHYTYTSAGGSVDHSSDMEMMRYTSINSKVLWSEALIANPIVYSIHIVQGLHE